MGVEPYLVASSVEAFVAQRLVRLICPQCKREAADIPDSVRQEMARSLRVPAASIKVYEGAGCETCNSTGYYGRTAIYEVLEMDESIRALLTGKPSHEKIKRAAMKKGMATLRQNGWQCAAKGITTVSEVLYVSSKDDLADFITDIAADAKQMAYAHFISNNPSDVIPAKAGIQK
jgi:type II secretory ATPase GspE/PulE/Tfp pilus assembly ATPase PilB-like protein